METANQKYKMTKALGFWFLSLVVCQLVFAIGAVAQDHTSVKAVAQVTWKDSLKQKPEWYAGDEAIRIADNVLLYQHNNGGWSKNIDMAAVLSEQEKAAIAKLKTQNDSNIDNGATYTQLIYLARVFQGAKLERHKTAFLKGVDYLLEAQQPHGGWPQYYPLRKGYYTHITFNDNAMIGVMKLLRDIAEKKGAYDFVDDERRNRSAKAVARGIEVILKTQVMVEGKLTVWGAQHDEVTFAPAPARAFEPVSLTGSESVGIVRFLMGIKHPDERVIKSIESAIQWFQKSKLTGIRWVEKPDSSKPHGFDRVVLKDPEAGPLWARFYEIKTNRPIFIGRDSQIKFDVSEIEAERRNGYNWYVDEPAKLLDREYPAWQKKLKN
jgi:PelA/Pel-15E family pectate lyase